MSLHIWTPEKNDPQVSDSTRKTLIGELKEQGMISLVKTGRQAINSDEHQALRGYIDELGFDLNRSSHEGQWPHRALKVGGSIAMRAYRHEGYNQTIDTLAVTTGQFAAQIDGIPEAYFSSLYEDDNLTAIMMEVFQTEDLKAPDPQGYYQVMGIGAGCVRFFMEKALAA